MDNSDVLQRNAAGELEVRVVNGTEKADAPANYDDVFTVNSEGKRALRVVGAGGGGGSGGLETVSHDETLSGNGTTNSPLSVVNPVPSDGTTGQVLIKTADGIEWADAATGGVTSVNGVQPVDGNVEITGDNITATVGEEEATITQHLTTLQQSINGKQDTLTAEQLAAANSGITSAKVASYDAYAGEISAAQSTADKADNAAEVAQQTANLAGQEAAQALSALAGKVNIAQGAENAGKVMTVGADGNLAPAAAQGGQFPQDSDYAPIQYSLEETDFTGYGRINLGALSDGVYEFYVKTKYDDTSGFSRHYYHLTVKNGEIVTTKPDTYIMPAPEAGAPGPMPTYTADGWASVDMNSWLWCVGKTGTDLIIDTMGGQLGLPLSFGLYGVTSGETIAYITKIRNTATGELLTPTVTLETEPSQFSSYNIGANVFRQYVQPSDSIRSGQFTLGEGYPSTYILVELNEILYPNATEINLINVGKPIGGTVSITGIDDTNDYITFDFKISRSEIVVKSVNANGVFSGTQVSFYKNQWNPTSSAIVLTKAGGFGVGTAKSYQSSVIFFGTPIPTVTTVIAVNAYDTINDYVLVQNITPTNDASITTVDSVIIEDLGNGYVRMHGKLTESTIAADGFAQMPVAFPAGYTMANADYNIQLTGSSAEMNADVNVDFDTPSTTGFNVDMKNLNTTTAATNVVVHWEVFGQKAV